MNPRNGAILALLFLATCSEDMQEPTPGSVESARHGLGTIAPSEVATWQRSGGSSLPKSRYLQAAAFDEARKVVVMFGGQIWDPSFGTSAPTQETWEWSTATGKWTDRTGTGAAPDARSGSAMAYDSQRKKFVLFGGRAGSGYNYEDTWEWDPQTGVWTDLTNAGKHPSARSQHGMVYEKSTGKILLFGGGRSSSSYGDPTAISISLGDTWELDPATRTWTSVQVTASPTARHDFGLVWDSTRNKAVLFGGMQTDIAGATGIPKRDTWEWDPATSAWSERTTQGTKPSARHAHAMAYDAGRSKVVVMGGWDITSGAAISDLWDWDPTSGAWTERLGGSEDNLPTPRMYASLVADDARSRLELVAGQSIYYPKGGYGTGGIMIIPPYPSPVPYPRYGGATSCEVWELDPAAATFTNRSAPSDTPTPRMNHAMAYNPSTGLVYVFGGNDLNGQNLDDLWSWNGKAWTEVTTSTRPSARTNAGLAYDPARKSLILFGGSSYDGLTFMGDTWEWTPAKGWVELISDGSPDGLAGHGMVTDMSRNKILLFGGGDTSVIYPPPYYGTSGPRPGSAMRNEVWEWDGSKLAWTNRTPISTTNSPTGRSSPALAFDEGRKKLFLYDSTSVMKESTWEPSSFWEWDPVSAGWTERSTGDTLDYVNLVYVAYDSVRRREVLLTDAKNYLSEQGQTWEIYAQGPTWYVRTLATVPPPRSGAAMVFDSGRGVVVLFGGIPYDGKANADETWEYKVKSLGNGAGCTAAFASNCASGNCVDGVCCESASCTGPCKSCNVAGSEGTCVLVKAGTEVPGSCSDGQACDGSGSCKSRNGQSCTGASTCASGNCADGVCCDLPCKGTCLSCNQAGRAGQCTPYTTGTDPESECKGGSGICKSTCDGVGSCAYPAYGTPCGNCLTCNGAGYCNIYDYRCYNTGGWGGYPYGYGGFPYGYGGFPYGYGGFPYRTGGMGGLRTAGAGGTGGYRIGGSGGSISGYGGFPYRTGGIFTGSTGGTLSSRGGTTGTPFNVGGAGGSATGRTGTNRDGGVGHAVTALQLRRPGCSCALGDANAVRSGLWEAIFLVGTALFVRRTRRR